MALLRRGVDSEQRYCPGKWVRGPLSKKMPRRLLFILPFLFYLFMCHVLRMLPILAIFVQLSHFYMYLW
jgi:hypothetical protein